MSKTESVPQVNDICRIAKGTTITGVIISSSDIRIDGNFDGNLHTKGKLVVGESSKIKGKIFCQSCDIWGNLEGELYVEEILNLKAKSSMAGMLKCTRLGIEVGANLNGTCNMINKEMDNKFVDEVFHPGKPAAQPADTQQRPAGK